MTIKSAQINKIFFSFVKCYCIFFTKGGNAMKHLKIIFGLLTCVFLFGCTEEEKMVEGTWKLVSYEKDGVAQQIADSTLTVHFESESHISISGDTGANNFYASIDLSNDKIETVSEIVTTKMAGTPEVMAFESEYLATLSGIDSFSINDENDVRYLTLQNSSENSVLKYQLQNGEKWVVQALYNGTSLEDISNVENKPYLIFAADGSLSGSTGINIVNLSYDVDKSKNEITIDEGVMTLKAGDEKSSEIETDFLSDLMDVTNYSQDGNTMNLLGGDGTILLQLVKE